MAVYGAGIVRDRVAANRLRGNVGAALGAGSADRSGIVRCRVAGRCACLDKGVAEEASGADGSGVVAVALPPVAIVMTAALPMRADELTVPELLVVASPWAAEVDIYPPEDEEELTAPELFVLALCAAPVTWLSPLSAVPVFVQVTVLDEVAQLN